MNEINNWTALGVKLPAELVKAIDVYEAIRYATVEHPPVFDLAGVNEKNAEDRINTLADELARAAVVGDAKRHALAAASQEVTRQAGAAVPAVITELTPAFERSVSSFTEAVNGLPDDLTSDQLVAAGAATVSLYLAAKEAAAHIAVVDGWLASLVDLPYYAGLPQEPCLRVTSPLNRDELLVLLNAHQANNVDPLVRDLNPVYVAAAKNGIAFKISDPREQAARREQIESAPVDRQRRRVTVV